MNHNTHNKIDIKTEDNIKQAATLIDNANNICILTGAGISAESGIPTFRDKQTGLWENYRAEDLANINAFKRDPEFVWSWYQWRRNLVKDKQPNPAHYALAKWQTYIQLSTEKTLNIITQNVDDLHEQAGSKVTHLHGHLWKNKCFDCSAPYTIHKEEISATDNTLKHCDQCGGIIRPDIVWFGEMLPQDEWQHAEQSARRCEVFISIGTSSIVYPAAGLSSLAKQNSAKIIEINPNPTDNPMIDVVIAEKAGIALPILVEQLVSS